MVRELEYAARVHFRDEFRRARASVQGDAEAFDEVIHVLERLGEQCSGAGDGLGKYTTSIAELAARSPLGGAVPHQLPKYHARPIEMLEHVRRARNDAMHQGAVARHLAAQVTEVAIVLEDALMAEEALVRDFMVENPVRAESWHPISWIRRTMLVNSFSFLPVRIERDSGASWEVISDEAIAKFVRSEGSTRAREERLLLTLDEAIRSGGLATRPVDRSRPQEPLERLVTRVSTWPVLVCSDEQDALVGILTAFDVL